MRSVREKGSDILNTAKESIRPVSFQDFECSIKMMKPSVDKGSISEYERWNKQFGNTSI